MAALSASRTTQSPAPPASTTPLAARASSCCCVRTSACRAPRAAARPTSARPEACAAARAAASATVRTVPSTGRCTAALARTAALASAVATTWPSHGEAGPQVSASPRSSWLTMMPELPQAPRSAAVVAACQTSAGLACAGRSTRASAAQAIVRCRFVPVSASGTGNTLSMSIADLVRPSASTARRNHSRTTSPSRASTAGMPCRLLRRSVGRLHAAERPDSWLPRTGCVRGLRAARADGRSRPPGLAVSRARPGAADGPGEAVLRRAWLAAGAAGGPDADRVALMGRRSDILVRPGRRRPAR